MTDNTRFEEVDRYISELLAPEDEVLKHTIQQISNHDLPQMSISANQGKLLQVLAATCQARKILEIGTFAGYSTIWMGRSLPADGKLISLEYEERHAAIAQENIEAAGLQDKVEIRTGKALDLLAQLEAAGEGPFDMIFIDADKPPYAEYFQWALKLSRPGTVIVADNVIRNGAVLDPNHADDKVQGVRRYNQVMADCKEVTATILQTVGVKEYDGIAIAVVNG